MRLTPFIKPVLAVVVIAVCGLVATRDAGAGVVWIGSGASQPAVEVASQWEIRFRTVARQEHDFSCGSAAIATLLSFHYDHPITEREIFLRMYEDGDKEKIRRDGFSLLDMKNFLEARGYRADGFRITIERLVEAGVPAVVLVNDEGYRHFVVIKGVRGDRVLLGDPAKGVRAISKAELEEISNGVLFVIRNKKEIGRAAFNRPDEWKAAPEPPTDAVAHWRDIAPTMLLLLPSHDL